MASTRRRPRSYQSSVGGNYTLPTETVKQFAMNNITIWIILSILLIGGLIFSLTAAAIFFSSAKRPDTSPPSHRAQPAPSRLETLTRPKQQFLLSNIDRGGDVIGRAMPGEGVTVRILEPIPGWDTVSRFHARIYREQGYIVVRDLDSLNGVYVNGQRTPLNRLKNGMRLAFGGAEFIYREPGPS